MIHLTVRDKNRDYVCHKSQSKAYGLSPIQIRILIFLRFHPVDKGRVSFLAEEFNLIKATISDSVRLLLAKELVSKEADPADLRSYRLTLTDKGRNIAREVSDFASAIRGPIEKLPESRKTAMLDGLLRLIRDLNRSGVITIQRMCHTCAHYQNDEGAHYCKLLESKLADNELRVDCPEHEAKV